MAILRFLGPLCVGLALCGLARAEAVPDTLKQPALAAARPQGALLLGVARAGQRLVAVGERGLAVFSDDDGTTWRQARVPVGVSLTAVTFTSATTGWAVGHRGVILQTTDAGASWTRRLDGVQYAALAVAQARAAAASDPQAARALKLAEALQRDGADKPLFAVDFADERHGLAVGAYGLCASTADAGATWSDCSPQLTNPDGLHLYAIARHGSAVYVVGEQGLALRGDSARPADRFQPLKVPSPTSLFFVAVDRGGDVVAGGLHGTAFAMHAADVAFEPLRSDTQAALTGAVHRRDGQLALVAQSGQVLRYDPAGRQLVAWPTPPLPPLSDATESASGRLVAVGVRGVHPIDLPNVPNVPPSRAHP